MYNELHGNMMMMMTMSETITALKTCAGIRSEKNKTHKLYFPKRYIVGALKSSKCSSALLSANFQTSNQNSAVKYYKYTMLSPYATYINFDFRLPPRC
jgi:hypothetical protein